MSDIVDRLRERVDSTEPGDTYAFGIEVAMLLEAADEIERLREATCGLPVDMARNAILAWTRDPIGWGMGEYQLEQLKAALPSASSSAS